MNGRPLEDIVKQYLIIIALLTILVHIVLDISIPYKKITILVSWDSRSIICFGWQHRENFAPPIIRIVCTISSTSTPPSAMHKLKHFTTFFSSLTSQLYLWTK